MTPSFPIAYYEAKAKNPGLDIVQMLADHFSVPLDQLIDDSHQEKRRTPGPVPKLEKQLELIRKLPKDKQKAISTVLDMALAQAAQ